MIHYYIESLIPIVIIDDNYNHDEEFIAPPSLYDWYEFKNKNES